MRQSDDFTLDKFIDKWCVGVRFNSDWSSLGSTFYVYKLMKGHYVMNLSGARDLKTL